MKWERGILLLLALEILEINVASKVVPVRQAECEIGIWSFISTSPHV